MASTVNSVTCALRLVDGQTGAGKDKIKSISLGKLQTACATTARDDDLVAIATAVKAFYSQTKKDIRKTVVNTLTA